MKDVRQATTAPTLDESNQIANVDTRNPTRINVLMPEHYSAPDLAHEMTHVFQNLHSVPGGSAQTQGEGRDEYSYGGIDGLKAAMRSGKTIANFNQEQQARIVQDYYREDRRLMDKAKAGTITPQEKHQLYEMRQVYPRFISQLAAMPKTGEEPTPLDTRPVAPSLPDYSVAGLNVVREDPLMGGGSAYAPVPPKGYKVVTSKR